MLQDTIKSPGENAKMKKATGLGIATTTFFYAAIGFIGYAAFGNSAPGNLISGQAPGALSGYVCCHAISCHDLQLQD